MGGTSGSGTNTTTTTNNTTTTNQVPQQIVNTGESLFNTAANYAASSGAGAQYPTFNPNTNLSSGLAQTAGFTPMQQQAFGITQGDVGSQAGSMNAAFQLANQASVPTGYGPNGQFLGNVDQSSILPNMNPYTQDVTNAGLYNLNNAYQNSLNQEDANAINGGAAWGSRSNINKQQAQQDYLLGVGNYAANQYSNAYNNAAGLAQQNWQNYSTNANANRSAASNLATLYPQLAQQGLSMDQSQAQALYGQGAAQQALTQQAIDTARNNQLAAQQYPLDILNKLSSFNTMQPYSTVSNVAQSQTQNQTQQPGLLQYLGAGVGALGLLGGGLFGSDERIKEKVTPPKMSPEDALAAVKKLPVSEWQYKPSAQAKGAPPGRNTGSMAQDYAKHFGPDAVRKAPDGTLLVNTPDVLGKLTLAVQALAKTKKRA